MSNRTDVLSVLPGLDICPKHAVANSNLRPGKADDVKRLRITNAFICLA